MTLQKQLPRLIMDVVVVIIAVLGTIFCVTTAFDLVVNPVILLLVTVIAALLFTTCFLWKKALWLLLPLGAVVILMGVFTSVFASVGPSLQQLLHDILTRFSSAYPNFSFAIPPEPTAYVSKDFTLLFSILAILLSVWMAWGVGYRSFLISVAGALPFLLLCVVINDTPPHVAPLVMLLSAWITVLLAKERPDEPASMDAMRLCLTLMAVLLVLSVVGTVYPKDDTKNQELPEVIQNILDRLPGPVQNMLSRNSEGIQNDELGADTSEVLDLTKQGTRDRKDTMMMQLSCTETGILYLRGAAKDIYTGSTWESRNEADTAESVYAQTSLGTAFGNVTQAAVQIRNYYDNATVAFTPYGFISCAGAESITSDLRVSCLQEDYIIYYWPGLNGLDLSTATGTVNEAYDSYVAETCLELPEETQTALYDLAISYGYDPQLSTIDTIAWVVEFVRSVGTYQLNVSRQPTNYDFAVYFLTESKAGYCVHFATAAATMLRALGVPARYASGYRVTVSEAGAVTDVTDKDTHAWAEVYLSGLGWIPVEATPGFGSSVSLPEVQHEPEPSASPSPEPSEEPAEATPSAEPSMEPSPSPSVSSVTPSEDPNGSAPSESPVAAASAASGGSSGLLWLLCIPVVLLLAILALLVRHSVILRRRIKKFHAGNRNQAVIQQWGYLERLAAWDQEPPKELEQLALKAKFSQHEISQEELTQFSMAVVAMEKQVKEKLTRWRRFRFKWFSCLDLPK